MIFQTVRLEEIDFGDETFRITDDLTPERMIASLKEIGQVNPVILLERTGGRKVIVCGFRRLHALLMMGRKEALARIEPPDRTTQEMFRLALIDNVSHRRLTAMECARALSSLRNSCTVNENTLTEVYLPMLGLRPHLKVLRSYLNLHRIMSGLRRLVREEQITVSSAERLAGMSTEVQERLARLLENVRLSASLQRKVLDLLEELGAATEGGILQVIDRPEIACIVDDPGQSMFQRGEKLHEALYRQLYPRLCRAHERFREKERMLALAGKVRMVPDPFFETPRVRFEFEVSSADEFRHSTAALERASQDPALDGLFRLD